MEKRRNDTEASPSGPSKRSKQTVTKPIRRELNDDFLRTTIEYLPEGSYRFFAPVNSQFRDVYRRTYPSCITWYVELVRSLPFRTVPQFSKP